MQSRSNNPIAHVVCLMLLALTTATTASADPLDSWSIRTAPVSAHWFRLAAGPDKLVAAASVEKQTIVSSDGKVWKPHVAESWTPWSATGHVYSTDLTYANGMFINVGRGIHTSRDGITWDLTWDPGRQGPYALAYGNGLYVAVGKKAWYSRDLKNWQQGNLDNVNALGLFFGKDRVVASLSAKPASVAISADGKSWQIKTLPGDGYPTTGTYANGHYVLMGRQGRAWSSSDAQNWQPIQTGANDTLWGVCWGSGRFVACGSGGKIVSSTDGSAWKEHSSGVTNSLIRIRFFKNTFVAVGDHGTILQSQEVSQ
jgi:hypothetical protein